MTPPDGRPTVGLLGTGRMGAAMARALAAAGYEVVALEPDARTGGRRSRRRSTGGPSRRRPTRPARPTSA